MSDSTADGEDRITVAPTEAHDERAFLHMAEGLTRFNAPHIWEGRDLEEVLEGRRSQMREVYRRAREGIALARLEGEAAGYVWAEIARSSFRTTGFINEIYVREPGRGLGAGGLLLDHALGWLISRGADRVMAQVHRWNAGAMRFYRRQGFDLHSITLSRDLTLGGEDR